MPSKRRASSTRSAPAPPRPAADGHLVARGRRGRPRRVPGCSRHSSSTSSGRSTAAVPTTTRSTPASSSSRADSAVRTPPPTWTRQATAAAIGAIGRGGRGLAGTGGVEVDHVDPPRAVGLELARDRDGIVVVDGLGREVAPEQAHARGRRAGRSPGRARPRSAQSVPLVDGTPAPSTRTASRRHRATPLNDASITW